MTGPRVRPAWPLLLLLLPLPPALAAAVPARAQTVVAWSPTAEDFGWCGKGDAACAIRQCAAFGSGDCTPVATCRSDWFAVAEPDGAQKGITVVCDMVRSVEAQLVALAACVTAANDLCWTRDVVHTDDGPEGDETIQERDRLMYAQALLQMTGRGEGFLISGEADRATIAAIGAFQDRVGLPVTGLTEAPLIFHLLAAAGGRQAFVDTFTRNVTQPQRDKGIVVATAIAAGPPARRTLGQEWLAMSPAHRTLALTSYLRERGYACDREGAVAEVLDAAGEIWSLTCAGTRYRVTFAASSVMVETNP